MKLSMGQTCKGKYLNIRTKFLISFIICVILPWLIGTTYTMTKYTDSLKTQYINSCIESINSVINDIEKNIELADQVLNTIFWSEYFNEMMIKVQDKTYSYEHYSAASMMDSYIGNLIGENKFIKGAIVFAGEVFTLPIGVPYLGDEIQQSEDFLLMQQSGAGVYYSKTFTMWDERVEEKEVFWIGRNISRLERLSDSRGHLDVLPEQLGAVVLIIEVDRLIESMLKSMPKEIKGMCLESRQGIIYSDIDADRMITIKSELKGDKEQRSGVMLYEDKGAKELILSVNSPRIGFTLYSVIDLQQTSGGFFGIEGTLALIYIFCVISFVIFTKMITHLITAPIQVLQTKMHRVAQGDLAVADKMIYSEDEIGRMYRDFEQMVANLEHMIQELHQNYQLNTALEIEMLQYQVNPHFLQNVLCSIRFKALMNKDEEVALMLKRVARLLSRTIEKSGQFIQVEMEIENLRDYIFIQNALFGKDIEVSIDIEPRLKGEYIPNMLLQPIVENCFLHGITVGSREFIVQVEGKFNEDEEIVFRVYDNGIGMDQGKIEEILDRDKVRGKNNYNGIGVSCVHKRIQLLYGKQYGVQIKSELGEFTEVTITLAKECTKEINGVQTTASRGK